MTIISHEGNVEEHLSAHLVEPYLYEFEFSRPNRGVSILEIFVNGEQIPESPVQVQVIDRDCEATFPGKNRIPVSLLPSVFIAKFQLTQVKLTA